MKTVVTEPWQIRLAEPPDLLQLAAIELAADELFPQERIPESDGTLPLALLEESCNSRLLWVAEAERRLVGCVVGCDREARVHIYLLAVIPAYGRRGIGRQLMQALLREAQRRKTLGASLTTFRDLPWNGPFYQSLGFQIVDESALSAFEREILAHEEALGMTRRVAMVFDCDDTTT